MCIFMYFNYAFYAVCTSLKYRSSSSMFFCLSAITEEPDWIAEFAKKQELVEKANKLKVINSQHFLKTVLQNWHVVHTLIIFTLLLIDESIVYCSCLSCHAHNGQAYIGHRLTSETYG